MSGRSTAISHPDRRAASRHLAAGGERHLAQPHLLRRRQERGGRRVVEAEGDEVVERARVTGDHRADSRPVARLGRDRLVLHERQRAPDGAERVAEVVAQEPVAFAQVGEQGVDESAHRRLSVTPGRAVQPAGDGERLRGGGVGGRCRVGDGALHVGEHHREQEVGVADDVVDREPGRERRPARRPAEPHHIARRARVPGAGGAAERGAGGGAVAGDHERRHLRRPQTRGERVHHLLGVREVGLGAGDRGAAVATRDRARRRAGRRCARPRASRTPTGAATRTPAAAATTAPAAATGATGATRRGVAASARSSQCCARCDAWALRVAATSSER
jgi:hypothetical protein